MSVADNRGRPGIDRKTIQEKFWSKVDKSGECWLWTGDKSRKPGRHYGRLTLTISGRHKVVQSHRLSWMLHNGPIPEGLLVCHRCDNPPCVRPDHLFIGTHADNTRDASLKGRLATKQSHPEKGGPRPQWQGENSRSSKLTTQQVRDIFKMFHDGIRPVSRIANHFGISREAINGIAFRRNWKAATEEMAHELQEQR